MFCKTLRTVAVCLLCAAAAGATEITFAGSGSGPTAGLAASATFNMSGNNLTVLLRNTSTNTVGEPAQLLTALLFNLTGNASGSTLTPVSAYLPAGSVIVNCTSPLSCAADGNVGGEWGVASNLATPQWGASYGISSAGLGIFGDAPRFGPLNLDGPIGIDGMQYGITSASYVSGSGNGGVSGNPLIKSSVLFTLSGLPSGFNPATGIGGVVFQYGTALNEGHFGGPPVDPPPPPPPPPPPEVPEPGTWALMGAGLLGLGLVRRKRVSGSSDQEA